MSLGPIPITAIMQYGQLYDCNEDLMLDLIEYVLAIDKVYLEYHAKKNKSKRKK